MQTEFSSQSSRGERGEPDSSSAVFFVVTTDPAAPTSCSPPAIPSAARSRAGISTTTYANMEPCCLASSRSTLRNTARWRRCASATTPNLAGLPSACLGASRAAPCTPDSRSTILVR